jgi:DEAD/DEAH box helicase domain-containing protein
VVEARSPHTGEPTVTLFERVPGGVGQAERLFALGGELLAAARALVEACGCAEGCPSCVGPVLEVGPRGKQHTLHLLKDARVHA